MFATMARKHYLREPCLLSRTTEIHLRTTNFRLLHFISLFRSDPLWPPPSSSFPSLSKMDDLPRGVVTNKGLNKKTLLFPPPPFSFASLYLDIHLSIQCYLWEVFSRLLKDFHLLYFPFIHPTSHPAVVRGQQYAMESAP